MEMKVRRECHHIPIHIVDEHMEFRQSCCDYMMNEDREFFQAFLDDEKLEDYVANMREDGTWGSQMEIVALSRAYNIKCVIFRPDGLHYRIEDASNTSSKILMISHHDDEHFNVVRFRDDSSLESFDDLVNVLELLSGNATRSLSKKERRQLARKGDYPDPPSQKLVNI